MPKEAIDVGAAEKIVPLEEIASAMIKFAQLK
jgi:chemotaxis response regulator CheB